MEKIRLLLVDSKKKGVNELSELFSTNYYIKHLAYSGKECLNLLLTEIVDIVLLSHNLNDLDSCEVTQLVKDNPKTKHIPIIFIADENTCEKKIIDVYKCGAFDCFYKPISKDVLTHRVNLLYDISSTKRELEDQIRVLKELNKRNVEMKQQVEKMASIDYLTEIANRRALDAKLSTEYVNALQEEKSLTLLMMDLDNFKMYNDYFGHQKGDRALRSIAKTSKLIVNKANGLIGRYGGEEFLAVINDSDQAKAIELAKTILKKIQQLEIEHSPVSQSKYLTLSIGVVSLIPNSDITIGKMIGLADEALYDAKNQGKNRFVIKNY